ncbi:hypothetical protein FSP39_020594 [Pinctada imbricata]|uniref:Heat shock 70 kDa protein 12A n=1 Tax=Pinctada imbricata TaxID=66713 RepID=A0AA88XTT9_PINIB|nr:hypothetical protein FSP39_020594 [Pinctada imbricata]
MGDNCLFFGAIDFGTSFTGYALASRKDLTEENVKFITSNWSSPFGSVTEYQTTSAVLFDPHGDFKACGFKAEEWYAGLALEEEELSKIEDAEEREHRDHNNWFFFRHFKMMLYDQLTMDRNHELTDDKGKTMPAIKVFSALIEYMKDDLLERCTKQYEDFREEDLMWTITVPAIWTDSAKQFMREASERAGIASDRLRIALEPECGAFYCRSLSSLRSEMKMLKTGSKYMVLDCGGGTIDIAVHEVLQGNKVKELYKSNGGQGGGTEVDKAFWKLLSSLVGREVVETFCDKNKYDQMSLIQNFEIKKKTINNEESNMQVTFRIPESLLRTFENVTGKTVDHEKVEESLTMDNYLIGKVKWRYDKLRVHKEVAVSLFDSSRKHIKKILMEQFRIPAVKSVDHIIMIGGFSEAPLIQEAVKACRPTAKIIVPKDASLAVVKGAVMFGYNPFVVHSRISRYTYGKKVLLKFDSKLDPPAYLTYDREGNRFCDNRFSVFLKEGDEIILNESEIVTTSTALFQDQEKMAIAIYVSKLGVPLYTTKCTKVGYIEFNVPKVSTKTNRKFRTIMRFGDTESRVRVLDMTSGKEVSSARFNFLG